MTGLKYSFLIFVALSFFSCANLPQTRITEEAPGNTARPESSCAADRENINLFPAPDFPRERTREFYLTIVAAGDNLYHNVMIRDGEEGDYESVYQEIQPLVERADIAIINQETLLAGEDFGFSGYPRFNTPQNVGRAIAAAGFNVINHATNHIMDRGEPAILSARDFWDTIPQANVLGIHRSEEERSLPILITRNNITVGFLSYTYGTNGIPVPANKPYLVSLINTETMGNEIDAIRPLCDFLVVSMHWGVEYQNEYDKSQEALAGFLAEHRVDLVIGHHPHVIQSIEYIKRPDGGLMLCFYSLGNFISAQTQTPTLLGALAYIKIKKITYNGKGKDSSVSIVDAGAIPMVSHFETGFTGFKIYPLYSYSEELLEKHWVNRVKKELSLDYFTGLAAKVLGNKEIYRNPFN